MKISIVTACFNSEDTIEDTLKSIAMQTHQDIEHIVIDGGSTDKTLEILNDYKQNIAYLTSEPDEGLYDAMNKGISKATGDIIGLLNSDDLFASKNTLSLVNKALSNENVDGCFGDLVYVNQKDTNKIVRYWKSCPYESELFAKGWMPAHPTFYVRKEVHDKYSIDFDVKYKLAADYDVLMRLLYTNKIKTTYIPEIMVKMRLGGATNKSLQNIIAQNKEIMAILKEHNYPFSSTKLFSQKIVDRLSQFIKKPAAIG